MKGILTIIFFFFTLYVSSQPVVILELLYNQPLGLDKFELVNNTGGTINISGYWMCSHRVYRNLGSPTSIEVLEGNLNMPAGSHIKLRIIDLNLNNSNDDFALYSSPDFFNPVAMVDFLFYGTAYVPLTGRGEEAVAKGIWRDLDPGSPFVLDVVPVAPANQSANFDGTNSGGGELTFSSDFFNGPATLPVSLLTLSSRINANKEVELTWIALDEFNSDKHSIERSFNGQAYYVIGEVVSQNLGSTPANYSFLDKNPTMNSLNYYRIRQKDFDGHEFLSSTLYVKVKDVDNHKIFISPMPIVNNACFMMELYWPKSENSVNFRIVDMSGKEVDSFSDPLEEGYNMVMHMFNDILPGQYLMILSNESGDYVAEKFIIAK